MIIITGIGRCGTSFMTKWLKKCGYNVGSDRWFTPMNAGLENRETIAINNRLANYYIKGQDENLFHIRGDIYDLRFDAVKDTQFLKHPAIIQEWADVREIDVIWMHRDPEAIVESVRRMPEWNTPVYRCFPDLIKMKCREFKKAVKKINHIQIMWPDILDNPAPIIEALEAWGYDLPEDADNIWYDLIDART